MCKPNPTLGLLNLWEKFGYKYISVSSPFEAKISLKSGIKPKYITFIAGVGATDKVFKEIRKLKINIVIDSFSQLKRISSLGVREISIRWNPGIGMGLIPAAGKGSYREPMQFGIPENRILDAFKFAKKKGIKIKGLVQHVGSQIIKKREILLYFKSINKLIEITKKLENLGYELDYICFGGGISIRYKKEDPEFPIDKLSKYLFDKVKTSKIKTKTIVLEPGRYLTADMGLLISRVNLVEEKQGNIFVGIDAGVNLVPRSLFFKYYKTQHKIVPCKKRDKKFEATICGPLLYTGDNFGTQKISEIKVGDYLIFLNVGAYNSPFEFRFGWPFAREILIFNKKLHCIREEEKFEDYSKNQFSIKS